MSDGGADYGNWSFTTRRGWLLQLAEWGMAAVPHSPSLPVNGCFKVTVTPQMLQLAATDQQLTVIAASPTVESKEGGEAFIPARKLREILAAAPEGDVTIAVKGNSARVTAGQASWSLRLPPSKSYIGLPELAGAEYTPADRKGLLSALQTVKHAVGKDLGRAEFTQVAFMQVNGVMCAAAADSSQFACAPAAGFPFPLSVPSGALDDLLKVLSKSPEAESVAVAQTDACVVFRIGPVTLAAARATRPFPDIAAQFLAPVSGHDRRLTVDRAELASALRRVRINANPRTSAVSLTASSGQGNATLSVTARDRDDSAEEVIAAAGWSVKAAGDWGPAGEDQQVVVNAVFLEAMLAVHPSAVCEFRLGRPRGQYRPPLLLEDKEAGVIGTCPQMPPERLGY
jgi:DNA polymerase III subunit beta